MAYLGEAGLRRGPHPARWRVRADQVRKPRLDRGIAPPQRVIRRIRDFRRRGKTIVFVSHSTEAVRTLCDRVVLLDHGMLVADGPTTQLLERYDELIHQPV